MVCVFVVQNTLTVSVTVQIYSTTEAKGKGKDEETETENWNQNEDWRAGGCPITRDSTSTVAELCGGACGYIYYLEDFVWLCERILVIIWRFWMDIWCLKGLFVPVSHWSFFEWGTSKFFIFYFFFFSLLSRRARVFYFKNLIIIVLVTVTVYTCLFL